MSIVGYFHANERFDDFELGGVAKNIGDHIYKYFPQAALLLVMLLFECVFVCVVDLYVLDFDFALSCCS